MGRALAQCEGVNHISQAGCSRRKDTHPWSRLPRAQLTATRLRPVLPPPLLPLLFLVSVPHSPFCLLCALRLCMTSSLITRTGK